MREIISLKDISRKDVFNALQIIQRVCHGYMGNCGYNTGVNAHCPFAINDECTFEVLAPDNWDIKAPDDWKAFNE